MNNGQKKDQNEWDLSYISGKYPWLTVDQTTLEDFRAPFDWQKGAEDVSQIAEKTSIYKTRKNDKKKTKVRRTVNEHRQKRHSQMAGRQIALSSMQNDLFELRQSLINPIAKTEHLEDTKGSDGTNIDAIDECVQKAQVEKRLSLHSPDNNAISSMVAQNNLAFHKTVASFKEMPKGLSKKYYRCGRGHKRKQSKYDCPSNNILTLTSKKLDKDRRAFDQIPKTLSKQIVAIKKEEEKLRDCLSLSIEEQRSKLPLQFLFQLNMDEYCRGKGVETITRIFTQLQHRMQFQAFEIWKILMLEFRKRIRQEKAEVRIKIRAIELLNRFAGDCITGSTEKALSRWKKYIRKSQEHDLKKAAILIQSLYRQHCANKRMKKIQEISASKDKMRQSQISELLKAQRQVYLDRWDILKFKVNGRKELQAARIIQKSIQLYVGKLRLHESARRRKAALKIQTCWRGQKGRFAMHLKRQAKKVMEEEQYNAAIKIQSMVKRFLGKCKLVHIREWEAIKNESAVSIQSFWRRINGKQVLVSRFAKRKTTIEEEKARKKIIEEQKRLARHRQILNNNATNLQNKLRRLLYLKKQRRLRYEQKLARAARIVQTSWRRSHGRYALHIRFLAQKSRREDAATTINRSVLYYLAKIRYQSLLSEKRMKDEASTDICRVFKGYLVRKKIQAEKDAQVAAANTIVRASKRKLARKRRKEEKINREKACINIQRMARGMAGRKQFKMRRELKSQEHDKRIKCATLIQKRIRGANTRKRINTIREANTVIAMVRSRSFESNNETLLEGIIGHLLVADGISNLTSDQVKLISIHTKESLKIIAQEDRAALLLQCIWRGRNARLTFKLKLQEKQKQNREEQTAAILIQKVFRGFIGRQRFKKQKEIRKKEEVHRLYLLERKAKKEREIWMQNFKENKLRKDVEMQKQIEMKITLAKQEAELARLEAEAAYYRQQRTSSSGYDQTYKHSYNEMDAWQEEIDDHGYVYYYNTMSGESSWNFPQAQNIESNYKDKEVGLQQVNKQLWDEVYDQSAGCIYYFNNVTGESQWEPPEDPTHAKVADTRKSKHEDTQVSKRVDTQESKPGFCWRCSSQKAVKQCNECITENQFYCSSCYVIEHRAGIKKKHTFILCDNSHRATCHYCFEGATRQCFECPLEIRFFCEECFPWHGEIAANHPNSSGNVDEHSQFYFRKSSILCSQCESLVARLECKAEICGSDVFCESCYSSLHQAKKKKNHESKPLDIAKEKLEDPTHEYCISCEIRRAIWLCNVCDESFCEACYVAIHEAETSTMKSHTWHSVDLLEKHNWLDISEGGKVLYFNTRTKQSTPDIPLCLLTPEERHEIKVIELEKEKKMLQVRQQAQELKATESKKGKYQKPIEERPIAPKLSSSKKKFTISSFSWKSKKKLKKKNEEEYLKNMLLNDSVKKEMEKSKEKFGTKGFTENILDDVVS